MSNCDDWIYQTNLKHGPLDDRGNPLYLTNVRAYTAQGLAESLDTLADEAERVHGALSRFVAVESLIGQGFEVNRQEPQHSQAQPAPAPAPAPRQKTPEEMQVGEWYPCPVNNRARHTKRGGMKNGNPWAGVLCNNKPTECEPVWL